MYFYFNIFKQFMCTHSNTKFMHLSLHEFRLSLRPALVLNAGFRTFGIFSYNGSFKIILFVKARIPRGGG